MSGPYYEDSAVTIHHGDCLAVLPTLGPCQHLITDPPYFGAVEAGNRRSLWAYSKKADPGPKARSFEFEAMNSERAGQILGLCKPSRWGLVFSDVEGADVWRSSLPEGWRFMRTGIWFKTYAQPQLTGDRPAAHAEAITIYHAKGKSRWNGGGKGNVWSHPTVRGGDRPDHPTPKPLPLMTQLIELFTDPGDLIVDPFGGSGTTARAAKDLGRRCVLIEASEKHCETAARRMRQEVLL